MKNDKNTFFNELYQSLGSHKAHLQVLETKVPVEKQMEFFRFSENIKSDESLDSVERRIEILNSPDTSEKEIKYTLASLAVSGDIKAYRALETYNKTHQDDWAIMSFIQAKIMMETTFSDEKLIFISTGLGGKGDKLRFAALFKSNHLKVFSDYQRDLIEKEIAFYINRNGGETEDINVAENYFTILFLIDYSVNVKTLLENAIIECNQ
ncbi:MAG: hypothetical protein LBT25_10770, partial [Candidatus Symbiothrix sp.]|nr:hypothetical protein [Candidatus Symbiothrix sp.]